MSGKNRAVFRKQLIFLAVFLLLISSISFISIAYAEEIATQDAFAISENSIANIDDNSDAAQEQEVKFSAGFLVDNWQKQAEPCDTTSYIVEVQNLADYADTYSLSADSDNKLFDESWVAVSENEFTLAAGEKRELAVFITPPCEVYGKLDVNLNFKSSVTELEAAVLLETNIARNYTYSLEAGRYETEKQTVSFVNKTSEEASVFKSSNKRYNICDNKKTLVPVKITNLVETGNIYSLEIEASKAAKKLAKFAHNGVALYGNTEAIVDLELEPALEEVGNYTLTLKALSERGELEQQDKIRVSVRECFGLKLDVTKEKDRLCNYNSKAYEVKVKNEGEFKEDVGLKVDGNCAKLSAYNLTVAAKQNSSFNLLINDKCKETGKNKVSVTAELLNNSDVQASDEIVLDFVDVEKCYKTEIEDGKRYISSQENGSKTEVKIQNLGTETVDYSVTLDVKPRILPWLKSRKDFVTASPAAFKLAQNKTQSVALNFDLDNVVPGRYDIKVKTIANGKVLFSRNILAIVGKDKFVNFAWYYKYYSLAALIILLILIWTLIASIKESLRVYVEEEFGIVDAGKEIAVKVDKGSMSAQELRIAAKQQLLDAKIRIEKLSSRKAKDSADLIYECFEIAAEKVIAYNLKSASLKFKVAKSWLEDNDLSQSDVALKILKGDRWHELKLTKSNSDAENAYYRADLKDFGLFAVTPNAEYYKRKAADEKQKEQEERKLLAEEAKKTEKREESKETQEKKSEVREKAEKSLKPVKKDTKKTKDAKPSSLLQKFAKFAGILILLLLIVLGVLNGYIYYLVGGVIGAGLIIGILKATEHYKSDDYKQRRKELEKRRLEEEREEAKERAEEEREEAQRQAEEERKAREQEREEAEKARREELDKRKQEAEQKRIEIEQQREEEKQRKLEGKKKLQEEARKNKEQERIASANEKAEARLAKKQKIEKTSYAEYLVIALIILALLLGIIYFAAPKLKDQLKSTLESFNKTTAAALPEIKRLNTTQPPINATQPKLEQPTITLIKQESKELSKAEQQKLEQEKKLAEIKIATELRTQQEEKRLEEERKKLEEQKLKLEADKKKAEEQKTADEEKKKQELERKAQEELAQKQQQKFLKKALEESIEDAVVKQQPKEEMPRLISRFNLKDYKNKLGTVLVKYLDYIVFSAGLLLVIIVIVNLFKTPDKGKKARTWETAGTGSRIKSAKENKVPAETQDFDDYKAESEQKSEKTATQKKGKKKNIGQRFSKKIVDFFFEEE